MPSCFARNCPVTLGLGQQDHKIRVVQNGLNLPAGQKVFDVLRQGRGDTALFAEHLPHGHKVAGGERVPEQDMELVKIAPGRNAAVKIHIDRRSYKVVGNVHGDLAEVFSQPFENDAHDMGRELYVGLVVEQVKGAGAVELQGGCHPAGLRLRLLQKLLVQVLEQGRLAVPDPQGHIPVDQPHTAVNHGLFDGLQAVLAAHHQLAQGQQKSAFMESGLSSSSRSSWMSIGLIWLGGAGGDLHHLAAQPPHQRGIFAHRIDNDNAILWDGEKHVDDLTLCGKGSCRSPWSRGRAVGRFQLFAVSHDDVMGKGVHAVVEGRPGHPELPGHKGNEDRRGAGCHAPLDFHLVIAQGQRGHKRLLLLPVQPLPRRSCISARYRPP